VGAWPLIVMIKKTMNNLLFNPCILIPVYNHEHALATMLDRLQNKELPIILVDDGSDQHCRDAMIELANRDHIVKLIRLPQNKGKGGALKAGFKVALDLGFSHALQIDADGQHDANDIDCFVTQGKKHSKAIICGYPIYDDSVPKHRFYARYLTHIWVWINSLSLTIKDSMCGFRCYPLQSIVELINSESTGNRMEFESEIMVRWVWRKGHVVNLPTRVSYPIDGVSHFSLWRDNALISTMHTRLFFGMLWRSPALLLRKLTAQHLDS